MKRNYHKIIPAVYAIVEKGDCVLFMVRQNTGYRDGQCSLPSGHVEEGESPIEAVIRETFEEVGIKVTRNDVYHSFTLYRLIDGEDERVDLFFTIKSEVEPVNTEPNKCEKLVWADKNNLPDNVFDYLKYVFKQIKDRKVYGEWKD